MGIQVIRCSAVLLILSSCVALRQEKELYREAAFCACLKINMKEVDSTYSMISADVSGAMILMNESVNPQVFNEVIAYTDSTTKLYYQNISHTTSMAEMSSHFIPLSCLGFYNSVGLKKYIKARIKANAPLDPDSWMPN